MIQTLSIPASSNALSELIEQQLDFVYSAALRQVRDPHLAEDVTQAVFILLWKKFPTLKPGTIIEGWLYEATRYASKSAMRSQRRREHHERLAGQREMPQNDHSAWEQMAPMLDEAMAGLGKTERDAVLLRYFRQKSFEEVAQSIGATEPATRKRVSRAVEKLRAFFARRGVTSSADVIASAIGLGAIRSAPPGLAGKTITAAGAGSAAETALVHATATTMAWAQSKVAVAIVTAVALGATAAVIVAQAAHTSAPAQVVEAPPAAPASQDLPAWRMKFDQAYRVDDNQLLKFVPQPFIPERNDYYRAEENYQWKLIKQAPDYFSFTWDGKLNKWGYGFVGRGLTLRTVLGQPFQLRTYEIEGPADLLDAPMRGDWILRKDVPFARMLPELVAVVQKVTGRTVSFEKQTVKRPAIIARGQFKFHPLAGQTSVVMHSGVMDKDSGGGGGTGSLQMFLDTLGSRAHQRIINETQGPLPADFAWLHHRSAYIDLEDQHREIKVRAMLDIVQEQSGLTFTIEPRNVPVWMIKAAVHRLRKRFRQLVKDQIASSVDGPEALQAELDYLILALTASE